MWFIYEERKKKISTEKGLGQSKEEKRQPEGKSVKDISEKGHCN